MNISAYTALMRLDKPIGIFLLWYPTAWALWFANQGRPSVMLGILFLFGTIIMRSAGCAINDFLDRKLDKKVARTRNRPLASGVLKPQQAVLTIGILLLLACFILLTLPIDCLYYAIAALVLTIIYPLCKRIIHAPQLILGFAFSMGIPMAYAASHQAFTMDTVFLLVVNILWILAYDTIYAMADKKDDVIAGIKSTAVYFGSYDQLFVAILQTIMHSLWLIWAIYTHANGWFYAFWIVGLLNLLWQHNLITDKAPDAYQQAFKANNMYGLFIWLGIIFS